MSKKLLPLIAGFGLFFLFCGYPKPKEEILIPIAEIKLRGYPNGMAFLPNSDYLFVATGQAGVEVISLEEIDKPKKVLAYFDGENTSWDVKVADSFCFLAYGKKELLVCQFFLPETIFPIGVNEYSVAYGYSLAYDSLRKMIYTAAREQFITFDVKEANYPIDVKKENFPFCRGIFFDGEYIYLACGELGVFIYQATDSFPVRVSSFDSSLNARDLWVKDTFLFLADGRALTIASIADKRNPRFLASIPISGYTQKITGFNNWLFLAAQDGGLYFYDISSFPLVEKAHLALGYVRCLIYHPEKEILLVGERDRGVIIYEIRDGHK